MAGGDTSAVFIFTCFESSSPAPSVNGGDTLRPTSSCVEGIEVDDHTSRSWRRPVRPYGDKGGSLNAAPNGRSSPNEVARGDPIMLLRLPMPLRRDPYVSGKPFFVGTGSVRIMDRPPTLLDIGLLWTGESGKKPLLA